MPDISMCSNHGCNSRLICHRFMATPSKFRQAYGDFDPAPGEDRCASFWPTALVAAIPHEGTK